MSAFGSADKIAGQPAWKHDVSPDFVSSTSSANPTVAVTTDGTALYALSTDMIRAFTPTGAELWHSSPFKAIQTPEPIFLEEPLPSAGSQTLVFHSTDAQNNENLTAMDTHSRKILWHVPSAIGNVALPPGPATIVGTSLYCLFPLHNDWSVCAFELRTGKVQWSYSIGLGTPHPGITYAAGKLYIGDPYRCTSLDASTGHKVWQYHLPTTVVATVLVSDGLALFGGLDGYFYALDATSGKLRWRTNLAAPVSARATAASGVLYVGDVDGYIWALDEASGDVYWRVFAGYNERQDAGTQYAVIAYPPVVYRNLVAVVAGDTLTAVDLISGTRRWPYQTAASNSSTRGMATGPLLAGGHFVVGDSQNHVVAINP
jgi:outer membrane protein assembly factor BamB